MTTSLFRFIPGMFPPVINLIGGGAPEAILT
jgi:hypothetical protein